MKRLTRLALVCLMILYTVNSWQFKSIRILPDPEKQEKQEP